MEETVGMEETAGIVEMLVLMLLQTVEKEGMAVMAVMVETEEMPVATLKEKEVENIGRVGTADIM